jgi:putative transposase
MSSSREQERSLCVLNEGGDSRRLQLRGHLTYCTNILNPAPCAHGTPRPHRRCGISASRNPGNRRQTIFFEPADYALYRDLLAERCRKASVEVWAYCLMPNHVHLSLTPSTPDGLARAIGETHRQYTGFINARARWTGHLFQGRARRRALGGSRALCGAQPGAGASGRVCAGLGMVERTCPSRRARRWAGACRPTARSCRPLLRPHRQQRRPRRLRRALGSSEFVAMLERVTGRRLRPQTPGRKPSARTDQVELRMPGMSSEE